MASNTKLQGVQIVELFFENGGSVNTLLKKASSDDAHFEIVVFGVKKSRINFRKTFTKTRIV